MVIGIIHSPVVRHLVPVRMVLSLEVWMVTLCLSNVALQPASHSLGMDRSDVFFSAGKMWASLAFGGRSGMSNCAVCVDWIVLLSGRYTVIGFLACCTSRSDGVPTARKWPVAAVSAAAVGFCGWREDVTVVGGSRSDDVELTSCSTS